MNNLHATSFQGFRFAEILEVPTMGFYLEKYQSFESKVGSSGGGAFISDGKSFADALRKKNPK